MSTSLLRVFGKQTLAARHTGFLKTQCTSMGTVEAYKEMDRYWKHNRNLQRPLSPHLTIYKPQLTSMLSLCHRITGIGMALTITGTSIALWYAPATFPVYLAMIQGMKFGKFIIIPAKFILAFPMTYHYINGMRHLAWDWAFGFSLAKTYSSGFFVLALSLLVSFLIVTEL